MEKTEQMGNLHDEWKRAREANAKARQAAQLANELANRLIRMDAFALSDGETKELDAAMDRMLGHLKAAERVLE